jgi:hypothetical protein
VLPGERITLIKKIAGRLSGGDLEETRLTLRQFGIIFRPHIIDTFTIDSFAGVVYSIEDASDETLLNLHAYLFGESAPSPATDARAAIAEIWPGELFRLFISHTSAHKRQVGSLSDFLKLEGISGFVAHVDIDPTREWQDVIESALETCDALAAYLTPDFQGSKWTDQEVGFCVARAILILPIRVDLDPYGFIGKYQALQGAEKAPHELAEGIADILVSHSLTASRMAAPAVRRFAAAYSFDNARKNLARIQRIPEEYWTPELIRMVEEAIRENDQLLHCYADGSSLPEVAESMLQPIREGLAEA